jgi:L-ascorbate metabolism protein UlaG (beta-lactamase superfamily)
MRDTSFQITYVGGPTVLIEIAGLRLLTDPTFDAPGNDYTTGPVTLSKISGPAIAADSIGPLDAVLLSHDHHADNLDVSGRQLLASAKKVLTTEAGASRLGNHAIGLAHWQSVDLSASDGRTLRITGTPARHGPSHMDRGPVTGFVLTLLDAPENSLYISGDTVWYKGVADVARRFSIHTAVLFLGAARVEIVGPFPLTMTAKHAIRAAIAFPDARIIPVHFEGWKHYSESRADVESIFRAYKLEERLLWINSGETKQLPLVTSLSH